MGVGFPDPRFFGRGNRAPTLSLPWPNGSVLCALNQAPVGVAYPIFMILACRTCFFALRAMSGSQGS